MRKVIWFCLFLCASCTSLSTVNVATLKSPAWTGTQFCEAPESAYYDTATQTILISNVSGQGDAKDGKGWIQRYSTDGKLLAEKWVTGLNAPKGMRVYDGKLWVSDIDRVVRIDIATGKIEQKISVRGAKFLNDVAISDDGTVFVSDTMAGIIFQIKKGKVSEFAKGADLESPNGLLVSGGKLIVAAWGLTTDWSTQTPGRLYTIDLKTKKREYITKAPLGNLDGLEIASNGDYLVSDWVAGKVFRVTPTGKSTELFHGMKGSADIGYVSNQNLLIIPIMGENRILALKLS